MLLNLSQWQEAARGRLPQSVYDYYAGGATDERALREGSQAYDDYHLYHRVLVDVHQPDTSATVLGQAVSMPVFIAPTAMQQMAHPLGEVGSARAAAAAGTLMIVSTLSTKSLEEVAAAAPGRLWFQLYIYKDRALTAELVARAERAGYTALVLTVDAPIFGRRWRDETNRFQMPEGLSLGNFQDEKMHLPDSQGSGLAAYVAAQLDPSLTWKDVDWLRTLTKLPLLVKGIVRCDDARRAVDAGVAGIVVSNHGGRQLDSSPPPLKALPAVVQAVEGRCEVFIDGGIRRGSDIIKALALGARAVLVGRPILWGLAVDGQAGVEQVLALFQRSLREDMALAGCASLAEIGPELLEA